MILAHHYQDSEIQEIADAVGDSLELSRVAQKFEGEVIVSAAWCSWRRPPRYLTFAHRRPADLDAGCSLVDSCPARKCEPFVKAIPITW